MRDVCAEKFERLAVATKAANVEKLARSASLNQ